MNLINKKAFFLLLGIMLLCGPSLWASYQEKLTEFKTAINNQDLNQVKNLVADSDFVLNTTTKDGGNLLHFLVQFYDTKYQQYVLPGGYKVRKRPGKSLRVDRFRIVDVAQWVIETVKQVTESGGDKALLSNYIDKRNAKDLTPLYLAAKAGNNHLVQILVKHGADIFLRTNQFTQEEVAEKQPSFHYTINASALDIAAHNHHLDVVKTLVAQALKKGNDVARRYILNLTDEEQARNPYKLNALQIAVSKATLPIQLSGYVYPALKTSYFLIDTLETLGMDLKQEKLSIDRHVKADRSMWSFGKRMNVELFFAQRNPFIRAGFLAALVTSAYFGVKYYKKRKHVKALASLKDALINLTLEHREGTLDTEQYEEQHKALLDDSWAFEKLLPEEQDDFLQSIQEASQE